MDYALIGEKLGHSYSPLIHRKFFEIENFNFGYNLLEIQKNELEEFVNKVKNGYLKGFNVTIPYKQDVMDFLDFIDEKASNIGAVNTVVNKNGKLYGYNTDYYGYLLTVLKLGAKVEGETCVILGNGGSAKAVIEALKDLKAKELYLVSRNLNKDVPLGVKSINYDELGQLNKGYLLTNCTPVGMFPNVGDSPVSKEIIGKFEFAIDLIYNPKMTKFLEEAKQLNLKFENGLYMLFAQAIRAEELWQEQSYDLDKLNIIFEELVSKVYGGIK